MSSAAQSSGKATDGQLEERIDLSVETTQKISQATALVSSAKSNPTALPSSLNDALSLLSGLEKKCRVGNDTPSLVKVCRTMLELCKDADTSQDAEILHSTLKQLSTRRSQKSKAIATLVETVSPWLVDTDGFTPLPTCTFASSARDALISTLRTITEGKMYLEAEYARITRCMAILLEQEGKVDEAANVLGEVHVETYGSLSKREKVEFVLEQMRLNLMRKVSLFMSDGATWLLLTFIVLL
jgi:26S proteasome regulatory subunit N5